MGGIKDIVNLTQPQAAGERGKNHDRELQPSKVSRISNNTWTFVYANAQNHSLYTML